MKKQIQLLITSLLLISMIICIPTAAYAGGFSKTNSVADDIDLITTICPDNPITAFISSEGVALLGKWPGDDNSSYWLEYKGEATFISLASIKGGKPLLKPMYNASGSLLWLEVTFSNDRSISYKFGDSLEGKIELLEKLQFEPTRCGDFIILEI